MNIFVMRHPSPWDNGPINLPSHWCSFIKMRDGCWCSNTSFTAVIAKWDYQIGKVSETSFGKSLSRRFDSASLLAPTDFCDERILSRSRINMNGDKINFVTPP